MKRALVVGGTGFIGSHLVRSLVERGVEVVAADVTPPARGVAGARFEVLDVRAPLPEDLTDGPPDTVFNLAAVHRVPGHEDCEYFDTNVAGARHVTDYCRAVGAETLVFTSSISTYGPSEEPRVETSTPAPTTAYGRSKLEAEQIHRRWQAEDERRRLVIARPAVIFGPGEGGNFTRLAGALHGRRFVYPGRRDTIKACGWVGELVRSMDFAVGLDRDVFLYNFCYPAPYTIEDICTALEEVGELPRPLGTFPLPVMRAAGRAFDLLEARGVRTGIGTARIMKLVQSTSIVPEALLDAGYTFETDLREGLRRWRDADPAGRFV